MRVTMYRIVTAKHYFEVVLQDVLAVRGCIVKSVNAMIAIAVEGQGVWTLDLRRNGTGRVHRGTVRNIDALIQVSARFFPTFANENYDARQALAAGEMIIDGNIAAIQRLSKILKNRKKVTATAGAFVAPKTQGFGLRRSA